MDNELSWIHLSDLHIETEDKFNRSIVLEALWKDIKKFIDNGMRPDFVVFTGDVTYHATREEFALAAKEFFDPLLELTSLGKDRLFIIPGNHDANWKISSGLVNPIPSLNSTDDIRKIIEDAERRDLILAPFSNYRDFVNSYVSQGNPDGDPAFYTVRQLVKGGLNIAVVGLNSAWLSGFNKNAEGKVEDYGKLALGEFQILKALELIDTAQIFIGLMHHPLDWLMEADRKVVADRLARSFNIILRGHLHHPNVHSESSLSGDLVTIPAGAVFEKRFLPNAYNLVNVNLMTGVGTVYLRRYNAGRSEWQKDIESTGEAADGQGAFKLRNFWYSAAFVVDRREDSPNIRAYTCVFTDQCRKDIAELGLTEEAVLKMVNGEFKYHLNYFKFDLEDYPLPVRSRYIVYLDKVQMRIEFRKIVPCTHNEAALASWNDILALYRRATRLSYREQPENILFIKGMLGRTTSLHIEIERRITKHFDDMEGIQVDKIIHQAVKRFPDEPKIQERYSDRSKEISYHLAESNRAIREVREIVDAMDKGDITHNSATGLIIAELERSLQHIHKILLGYPPVDSAS